MKKTLIYGTATAVVALSLTGCPAGTDPVEAVYGPPPSSVQNQEVDEPIEDVYGPAPVIDEGEAVEHDEDDTMLVALYGPPPEELESE